jgi:ABC-type glutathione transport system ATPase component
METELVGQFVLEGVGLRKAFKAGTFATDFFSAQRSSASEVNALDDASIRVAEGTTLAIVGESGSGKSTFARALTMLDPPDHGQVMFRGDDLTRLHGSALRKVLPRLQLLFQDSASSFNPRFSAAEAVAEPLLIAGALGRDQREQRVRALLEDVGLEVDAASRLVHTFSGGQKQRLAIARALAAQPALMVFDETFSGLDLSLRMQMLALLKDLQRKHHLTFILITHDLDLASHFAQQIAVMQLGKIVEAGPTATVLSTPAHAHTRALLKGTNSLRGVPERLP